MQQGDQTVLSLRPGGGRGTGGLLRRPTSSSSSAATFSFGSLSSDLPLLRPHGGAPSSFPSKVEGRERIKYSREQLLQITEIVERLEPSDEILKLKKEFESELFGEEQNWTRAENNKQCRSVLSKHGVL